MDTAFAPEDIAFRDEVRAFFAEAYDEEIQQRLASSDPQVYEAAVVEWQKRLHRQGWIAPGWPVEHGGTGWDATKRVHLCRPNAPPPGCATWCLLA